MAKKFIQILPGNSFELRFLSGRHKDKLRAMGGISVTNEKYGDWPQENIEMKVPRDHLSLPAGSAFDIKYTTGKKEGQTRLSGAYSSMGYKTGVWIETDKDGGARKGLYGVKGEKEGRWQSFYANGHKHRDCHYHFGALVGSYQSFFDNGKLEHAGMFGANNVKEGEWVQYNKDGRVLWHGLYENGKQTKKWQTPDGPATYQCIPKTVELLSMFIDNMEQPKRETAPSVSIPNLVP